MSTRCVLNGRPTQIFLYLILIDLLICNGMTGNILLQWYRTPQIYFVDETVKNLKSELARGSKIKCNKCGRKGAALGCYVKSCRRSYHVPCAREIETCRWDYASALTQYVFMVKFSCYQSTIVVSNMIFFRFLQENYLLLCPVHSSHRFPNENSKSKNHASKNGLMPSKMYILFLLHWFHTDMLLYDVLLVNFAKLNLQDVSIRCFIWFPFFIQRTSAA